VKYRAACQLLTAIDDGNEAAARLLDPNYAVRQKFDGKRIMLQEKYVLVAPEEIQETTASPLTLVAPESGTPKTRRKRQVA